jgi:hypothetical protein
MQAPVGLISLGIEFRTVPPFEEAGVPELAVPPWPEDDTAE